jgi:rubrerythrin
MKKVTRKIEQNRKSADVLELSLAHCKNGRCWSCGFGMIGGADVGLCPKCGSNRWYKTQLDNV